MEPIEYARLVRRRWRVVAACVLVSAVAVWVVTPASPVEREPEFVAEHTIIRDAEAAPATSQALATVALFVKTGDVPQRVAKRISYTRDPKLLARSIETDADELTGTLAVRATANGRQAASDLANAFAEETLAVLGERAQEARDKANGDLVARLTKRRATIDDLERQSAAARASGRSPELIDEQRDAELRVYGTDLELQQKQADLAPPTAGFVTLESASADLAKPRGAGLGVPASRPVRTAGAAVLGLLLGAVVAIVVERVDPRISVRAGAEKAFRLPVVAEVPYAGRRQRFDVLTATEPSSGVAEAHRAVRAALLLIPGNVLGRADDIPEPEPAPAPGGVTIPSMLGPTGNGHSTRVPNSSGTAAAGEPQVILVTSAAPSEGKTATVANLAASFAETGRSVLVLSCDFRRPSIHEHLGVRQAWGLTDVLEQRPDAPKLADVVKDSIIPGVRIATNGSPLDNYGEVTANGRQLVGESRRLADIVLIDTAPLLVAHEASELIPAADTVLIVCRSGQTSKEDAGRTRELLTRLRASVAGVVLVGAPESDTGYSTYYDHQPKRRRSVGSWLLGRAPVPVDDGNVDVEPPPDHRRKRAVT